MDIDRYTVLGFMAVVVAPVTLVATAVSAMSSDAPKEKPAVVQVQTSETVSKPTVDQKSGSWEYHTNSDKMDGTKWTNAILKSSSSEEFSWPYKKDGRLSLIYQTSGNLLISGRGTPGFNCIVDCYINFKFDDGEVIRVQAYGMSNGDSDTIRVNDPKVTNQINSASKILVGPSFLGDNQNRVFEFDAKGFDQSKMIKS